MIERLTGPGLMSGITSPHSALHLAGAVAGEGGPTSESLDLAGAVNGEGVPTSKSLVWAWELYVSSRIHT